MTKTITIRDDVYRRLMAVKRPGESFSELFERLIESAGGSVNVLVKLRGRVEVSDKEKMISEISSLREERR
ncbi:MAG: antitoxin VapB family protein [Candidatus Jordarchaeales archaeon]